MRKKVSGYMTIEASFVMPVVLLLYILIILCGFFLYNRCVISQDAYLLALRGSRFTCGENNYGEIIYGSMNEKPPDIQYMERRLENRLSFYPFYHMETKKIELAGNHVSIMLTGYGGTLKIKKSAERFNIIEIVERTGKNDRGKIL